MYPRVAQQRGLEYNEALLELDFSINIRKTLEIAVGSSLLVVCNPNNPTGNQFPKEDLLRLVEGFSGLVLVDEAYQEYSAFSLINEVKSFENLVVLRTFSKAYGLAGLRLGYCVANSEFATILRERYMMPFPVSNVVLKAGIKVIRKQELIQKTIDKTRAERNWLRNQLNNFDGIEAYPSETNFILFKTRKPSDEVYTFLQSGGIYVRKIDNLLDQKNYLRVTVAPRPQLLRFLSVLEEAIK
jgi:histidinol-phosphate aminotransferase